MHVPRRLYEGLPWLYIALGAAALGASYLSAAWRAASLITGIAGLAGVLGGVVLLLRRRDFRELGERYDAGRAGPLEDAPPPAAQPDRDQD